MLVLADNFCSDYCVVLIFSILIVSDSNVPYFSLFFPQLSFLLVPLEEESEGRDDALNLFGVALDEPSEFI